MKQFKSLLIYGLVGYLFILSIVTLLTYNVFLYFGKGGRKPITKPIEEKSYVLDNEPKKPSKNDSNNTIKIQKQTNKIIPQVTPQVKDSFKEKVDSAINPIDSLKTL
jgi:hypothetical protein